MFDKLEYQSIRDMYPLSQVIHKLSASDNVKIRQGNIFVLVSHSVSLHFDYPNISFIIHSNIKRTVHTHDLGHCTSYIPTKHMDKVDDYPRNKDILVDNHLTFLTTDYPPWLSDHLSWSFSFCVKSHHCQQ